MEVVKVFDKKDAKLDWTYGSEADTLYLSFGSPRPATGVDIGQGVIVRWDEALKEVVGITIVGVVGGLVMLVASTWLAGLVPRKRRT